MIEKKRAFECSYQTFIYIPSPSLFSICPSPLSFIPSHLRSPIQTIHVLGNLHIFMIPAKQVSFLSLSQSTSHWHAEASTLFLDGNYILKQQTSCHYCEGKHLPSLLLLMHLISISSSVPLLFSLLPSHPSSPSASLIPPSTDSQRFGEPSLNYQYGLLFPGYCTLTRALMALILRRSHE